MGAPGRGCGQPDSRGVAAEVYLALVESELGDARTALATLDDAQHNYDVGYGKLHANHGDLLVYRAMILKTAKRMNEAHADCAEGLQILQKVGAGDSGLYRSDAEICRTL